MIFFDLDGARRRIGLLITLVAFVVGEELFQHANSYDVPERDDRCQRVIRADRRNILQAGANSIESVRHFCHLDDERDRYEGIPSVAGC